MKRNIVRLTESQLHNVIKESVRRIVNEISSEKVGNTIGKAIGAARNQNDLTLGTKTGKRFARKFNKQGKDEDAYMAQAQRIAKLADERGMERNDKAVKKGFDDTRE